MANFFRKVGTTFKNLFTKIGNSFKNTFNKENLTYSYHKYKAFVALQAKEAFDFSLGKETKDKVLKIATTAIKIIAVLAITFLVCFLCGLFGLIPSNRFYEFLLFLTVVIFVIEVIVSMVDSTKNYYIAEDNKVLITFPSAGSTLFLSKLTIQFLKQLRAAVYFYYPIVLGVIIYGLTIKMTPFSIVSIFWCILPIILLVAIETLLGALLSVLWLGFLRLIKRFPIIEIILFIALGAGFIYLAVYLINLIPPNIDIGLTWNSIKANIDTFLKAFRDTMVPFNFFGTTMVGERGAGYLGFKLKGIHFARFALLLAIVLGLLLIVFLVIRQLFLFMMTKSNDYEKVKENALSKNHRHGHYITFAYKELKISFRTVEISGNYILTYVLIPILTLLLCRIFNAINTSMQGDVLVVMFNILLITLPLLASNASLASAYSREGHAGYIKKTKPVNPLVPLFSKLLFNLFLTIPSIAVSVFIFGKYSNIGVLPVVLLGISILLIQYGHIFFTSSLDITNPKNEQYQTEGQSAKNSNEIISTIVAFVIAGVFAFLTYFLFNQSLSYAYEDYTKAAIRLLLIGVGVFGSFLTLYLLNIKAFFVEK
mgnify:CR=1 FL=1